MLPERLTLCTDCPAGQSLFAGLSKDQTNAVLFCPYGEDTCSVEATAIHHQTTSEPGATDDDAPVLKTYAIIYGWCGLAHGRLGSSFFQRRVQVTPVPPATET